MERYDFIFRGGTLLDEENGGVHTRDVYVRGNRIAPAPEPGQECDAGMVVEARGKYVLPGLIDRHAHLYYEGSNIGAPADALCLPSGVTTAGDGGTAGWATFPLLHKTAQLRYLTDIKCFLHLSPFGVHDVEGWAESHDPAVFDQERILETIRQYPDAIRGLKILMDAKTLGDRGLAPLRRAVEIANLANAEGYHCALDVHVANLPQSLDICDVAAAMRPGDIFTHVFQNRGQTIFDDGGHIRQGILDARERGVLFDCCNGRIHWSFENYHRALADDFLPDIISSDIVRPSVYMRPGFSLIHAMCALLAAGMEETAILRAVTKNPAKAMGIYGPAGSLRVGSPADIAVLEMAPSDQLLVDRFGGQVKAERIFLPLMTLKRGQVVFRQIFF